MGTYWGQKRYCDIYCNSRWEWDWHHFECCIFISHCGFLSLSCSLFSLLVLVETAVNIGYSCKLLDPDTRLLEWQELRLAMIKIHKHTHTLTPAHWSLYVCPCRQILQSPDPGVSFFKARQTELWAVDKQAAGAKTAVVLTGPELVNTGHTGNGVTHIVYKWSNSCLQIVCNCHRLG